MTEFFIEFDRRRARKRIKFVVLSAVIVAGWIVFSFYPMLSMSGGRRGSPVSLPVTVLIVALLFVQQRWTLRHSGGFTEIFARADKERLLDLRLTPLSAREMAAVEVARAVARRQRPGRLALQLAWPLAIMAALPMALDRFGAPPPKHSSYAIFYAGLLAIFAGGWQMRISQLPRAAMWLLNRALRPGLRRAPGLFGAKRRRMFLFIFVIAGIMGVAPFFLLAPGRTSVLSPDYFLRMLGVMWLVMPLLWMAQRRFVMRDDEDFEFLMAQAEKGYEQRLEALAEKS